MAHFKIGAGFVVRLLFALFFLSSSAHAYYTGLGSACHTSFAAACISYGSDYVVQYVSGIEKCKNKISGDFVPVTFTPGSCPSPTPVPPTSTPTPTPASCTAGQRSSSTVYSGWSTLDKTTNPPIETAYRGPSYQDFFTPFTSACQNGCKVDIFPGDPQRGSYDSESGANGWYRSGYNFETETTGQSCTGELQTDQSGSEPPPQLCGQVNGQTVCVDAPGSGTGTPAPTPNPGTGTPIPVGSGTPDPGGGGGNGGGTPPPGGNGTPQPGYTPQPNCGLPGNPPCKIDEDGTPDGKADAQGWLDGLDGVFGDTDSLLSDIKSGDGKDTTWSILPSWLVPVACTPWNFGTFAGINVALVIDICPHVDLAQSVINFIAYFFTFLGVTGMVFTTLTRGSS